MKCFKCGKELHQDSNYCQFCGADLSQGLYCGNCGAIVQEGINFCNICGQRLSETEESTIAAAEPEIVEQVPVTGEVKEEAPIVTVNWDAEESFMRQTAEPPKAKRKTLPIVFALIAVVLVAIGGFILCGCAE